MRALIILARLVAIAASGFLLLSIANGTAQATNATGADLDAIYALALGVFVTAGIVGVAFSAKRRVLGCFLIFCLFCGEGYNLLKTAEREVLARETIQSATDERLVARGDMRKDITDAKAALVTAQAAVLVNAPAKSCIKNCAQLLADAVTNAQAALDAAKAAYGKTKRPPSTSALSERSGVASWIVDLLAASLKSLAMNGLAAGLVAFGAHGISVPERKAAVATPVATMPNSDARGFAIDDNLSDADLAAVADYLGGDIGPDGNGGPKGGNVVSIRRFSREEVRADLTARIERGEAWPSQRALAAQFGLKPSTLSEWFSQWAAEGNGFNRRQVGRRKMVG